VSEKRYTHTRVAFHMSSSTHYKRHAERVSEKGKEGESERERVSEKGKEGERGSERERETGGERE